MTVIKIKQGALQGEIQKTGSGFEYTEFLEIPYAKPPVGELRFKPPQQPEPWEGTRAATAAKEEHTCKQYDFIQGSVRGSEDCLYLNVYTPSLPKENAPLLPVMVYIHGGGFVVGNGILKAEGGPDLLIEHNVVLVTINYRLGVFGFLSLDIPEAAGNAGLKDQVFALKWIQENIGAFGGDKSNVTIFGISAGAASVNYQILSPLSKGLFHKAILQSGSPLNQWAVNYDPKGYVKILLEILGYQGSTQNTRAIYDFLQTLSTDELFHAAVEFSKKSPVKGMTFGFVPTIEKDFGDNSAFITENPYTLLKTGKFNKVSTITGFCEFEGFLMSALHKEQYEEFLKKKRFVEYWTYPLNSEDAEEYNKKLTKAYFDNPRDADIQRRAIDFFGDFYFSGGIWITAKLLAEHGVPIRVYEFVYDGGFNLLRVYFKQDMKGAGHGDDSGYVLSMPMLSAMLKPTADDYTMQNRMSKMWTDFAKTGNPTPATSELTPVDWPTFDGNNLKYLVINKKLSIESSYEPERINVLEEIYEKYEK